MQIIPGRTAIPSDQRGPTFTGTVWADPVLLTTDGVTVNDVFFPPGARTHWHTHEGGQLLQVKGGHGWAITRAGAGGAIRTGDTVWIAPGEEHWHGAAADGWMLHTAISLGGHEWLDAVSEDDYAGAGA